jgi:tetratricopeptide (TPR) repeat protein
MNNEKLSAVFTQLCLAGIALREAGMYADALKCFEALSIGDDSFECGDYAFEIALCYEGMGKAVKAREFMNIAVSENPDFYSSRIEAKRIGYDAK